MRLPALPDRKPARHVHSAPCASARTVPAHDRSSACQAGRPARRNQKVDERIVDSGGDFARKFDETVDRAVLDEIDRRVRAT